MSRTRNSDPIQAWMRSMKKKFRRKAFRIKVKLVLSVILPGVIAILGTAAARIFLRMTLRKAGSGVRTDPSEKKRRKAAHRNGILAWPAHEDAEKTEDAAEVAAAENAAETAAVAADAAGVAAAAAEPSAAIRPEPVVLESTRPEFVTPEAVRTEVLN